MSLAVGFSMPCLEFAFLVCRVADQSFSSGLEFITRRGKVSVLLGFSFSGVRGGETYNGLAL